MRKKIKIVFQIFFISLVIVAVLGFFIRFWFFYEKEKSSQRFVADLTGEFSPSKKTFSVAEGIVVFETLPRNCFLLKYGKGQGGTVFPWEDAVFITATFNGVTKKMSAENCWMSTPGGGELTMALDSNPKYFDSEQVKVFTGVQDNSPTGFVGGYLLVNIYQYKSDEEIGKLPKVVDLPKPTAPTTPKPEKAEAKKNGKTFCGIPLPDLSEDKKGDDKKGLFAPLSPEKQKEIKRRWDASSEKGVRLWNKIFSPDKKGEKGGKK